MAADARTLTVLVYASDPVVRERVRLALGKRPAKDLVIDYLEASSGGEVVEICDQRYVDIAILDGEAAPTGGMGLARQVKDEVEQPPLALVLTGRRDDAWLATWSRADAAVPHPIDAVRLTDAVVDLARRTNGRRPAQPA